MFIRKGLQEWPGLCRRGNHAYTLSILVAGVTSTFLLDDPWGGAAGWAAAVVVMLWLLGIGFHIAAIVKGWKHAGFRGIIVGCTLVPLLMFVTVSLIGELAGGL